MGKDAPKKAAGKYKSFSGDPKGGFTLQTGSAGFMVTCHLRKEASAAEEIISLFEEHWEAAYEDTSISASTGNVEDDLAKELAELKDTKKQLFSKVSTTIDCCIFIQAHSKVNPVEFTLSLVEWLQKAQKKKTRYTSRIIPFQKTCFASPTEVYKMAQKYIEDVLGALESTTFAIVPKTRHNSKFNRDSIIENVAKMVGPQHKVDLKDPEYCIIIEILNHVCGISIVKDYFKYKKFNLEQL